jgi:hypothetical protein
MPESVEVLDRPRFQKQTLIAQIAQIDSCCSFAFFGCECCFDPLQETGVSDGVANREFAMTAKTLLLFSASFCVLLRVLRLPA